MKVAQVVADFIAGLGDKKNVYAICGGSAMHLNDAICHHPGINVIPMLHEQAATYAAEGEARITNEIGVVHVTAGPGGSNTLTGVAGAYVDSIPLLVIAGQVTRSTMIGNSGLRQSGMNELDMVSLMRPITKFAVTVCQPFMIRYYLEYAVHVARSGRPGPVFIEIPLDIQAAEVPDRLSGYHPIGVPTVRIETGETLELLKASKRPVVIVGNGVRGAVEEFRSFAGRLHIPVVASWTARDIVAGLPSFIGSCGLFGDRSSNYAVQNADLILAIGTRLSVGQIGHHSHLFAPKAKKIVVDIDPDECLKDSIKADIGIVADAKDFLTSFPGCGVDRGEWVVECIRREDAVAPSRGGIGVYEFLETLANELDDDAIIVTDCGFSFIPTMQSLKLRYGQRLIFSCGVAPMGWGIPAAIGAANAAPERQVVCITGDGGAMMNIQELHTIAQHGLPISIFVIANNGYATMRIPQMNHFGRESISGPKSGVAISPGGFVALAAGFGLPSEAYGDLERLWRSDPLKGPYISVLEMDPDQVISPRVQATLGADGKFKPATLEDIWPPLPEVSIKKLDAVFGT